MSLRLCLRESLERFLRNREGPRSGYTVTLLRFGLSHKKMRDARAIFGAFVFIGKQPLPPPLARALLRGAFIFLTRISIKLEGRA